jgi:transposase
VCVLRSSLRQRRMLVAMASRAVQPMQKALEHTHLKLTEVVSDSTGKTGITIIRAILAGECDSQVLATHRDKRCTHAQATLAKALEGHWRAEHLCALQQAVEQYAFMQQQWRAYDQQIAACLQTFVTPAEMESPRPVPARKRRAHQRHPPDF